MQCSKLCNFLVLQQESLQLWLIRDYKMQLWLVCEKRGRCVGSRHKVNTTDSFVTSRHNGHLYCGELVGSATPPLCIYMQLKRANGLCVRDGGGGWACMCGFLCARRSQSYKSGATIIQLISTIIYSAWYHFFLPPLLASAVKLIAAMQVCRTSPVVAGSPSIMPSASLSPPRSAIPFKVCIPSRGSARYGVAASSYQHLRHVIRHKYKVSGGFYFQQEDGTLVCDEDYFQLLEPRTLLTVIETPSPPSLPAAVGE